MPKAKEITDAANTRYLAERLTQPVVLACRFCDWTTSGTFGDTKLLAEAHRRSIHPEAKQRTRLIRSRAGIRAIGTKTLEENVAAARLQGGSGWASTEGTYVE